MIFLFVKGSIKKICYADNFSNENKAYRSVAVEVKVNVNDISAGDEFLTIIILKIIKLWMRRSL